MTELLIIFGLILLNGFFAMAEIALVSARKARLEAQAAKGDEAARQALELAAQPARLISTVQIGLTLIGILIGNLSGRAMEGDLSSWLRRFHWLGQHTEDLATVIIVLVVSYFVLVLGELVPKRIGLSAPETIGKALSGIMSVLSKVMFPFTWTLTKSSNFLYRIFRIENHENQVTEDEIKAIINEGTEHGAIEEAEQEIIERVFHLGDRNITSLMTHRSDIIWFDLDSPVAAVRDRVRESTHYTYPLCDKNIDDIKGIITLKDLFRVEPSTRLSEIMRPALYVPENNSAYQVLEKFKQAKIHSCFIVDEYGTLQGMVTLNDILEAIVGDMPETGQDDYEILRRSDGSYLVDGQLPFYDFMQYFDKLEWIDTEEMEYDTLAGFILHELERIPSTGEMLQWKNFVFEIVDMDGHRIDKVLVTVKAEPGSEEEKGDDSP
ncbi:MAG TPA: hemolysin family protein [Dinghuibacter sp.]|jgi:putative hemolysin|uniref:hemolysin family protein n=1 Tax=Dinghuibacter sp. TaxID=2024697 RepID=UPI002BB4747E|nr:hemolysin family protein [Dinghuibacter sp.]HTJ13769.1 hemolysin family protein [Dinghuibacter sp.]